MSSHKNIFKFIICGTDTDIGKTLISSFFVKGLNSFYWKPIQSGIESQTDSQTVEKLAQVSKEKIIKEAYVFTKPLSPHWAAEIDQKTIDFDKLSLPKVQGSLIAQHTRWYLKDSNWQLLHQFLFVQLLVNTIKEMCHYLRL